MSNNFKYNNIFLSLGANLGNREQNILDAIEQIINNPLLKVVACSKLYETEPFGYLEQPNFINMALKLDTDFSASDLFYFLKEIEKKIGRVQRERWREREIDIDIIFFGNEIINLPFLQIPHSQAHLREFVLKPIAEIDGNFIHPILQKEISELLKDII